MYIKQVILHGFKSYKDRTELNAISPEVNVVVGANGSGKSNFFHAIKFVLGADDDQGHAQELRQRLLHEGTGQVQRAWVEIVFDNRDRRLGGDKDTVRLRREITLKDEKFRLDDKHIDKREVLNALEAAGFSRANPYNIVQQGKIAQLSTQSDEARLRMLKDIGGASTYEAKRTQSAAEMAEQRERAAEIDATLATIESRLERLRAEHQELLKYNSLDGEKRALEFRLLEADEASVQARLEQVKRRQQEAEAEAEEGAGAEAATSAASEAADAAAALKRAADGAERAVSAAEAAAEALTQERAVLDVEIKELDKRVENRDVDSAFLITTRERVAKELNDIKAQLEVLRAQKEAHEVERAGHAARRDELESQRSELLKRQAHAERFKSKEERDDYLRGHVKEVKRMCEAMRESAGKAAASLAAADQGVAASRARLDEARSTQRMAGDKAHAAREVMEAAREASEVLSERRKEAWRGGVAAEERLKEARSREEAARRELTRCMPHELVSALAGLEREVAARGLAGVRGPIVDLFRFKTADAEASEGKHPISKAIERTAMNRLFNVVVRDAATATACIDIMREKRLGRLTFLPLDSLREDSRFTREAVKQRITSFVSQAPPGLDVPRDCLVPLVRQLTFEADVGAAVQAVWARNVIAKTPEIAAAAARAIDVECVTTAGDKYGTKGTIDGGHVSRDRLRIPHWRALRAAGADAAAALTKKREAEEEAASLGTKIAHAGDREREADRALRAARIADSRATENVQQLEKEVAEQVRAQSTAASALQKVQEKVEQLQAKVQRYRTEMDTPLEGDGRAEDRATLRRFQEEKDSVDKAIAELRSKVRGAEDDVHTAEKARVAASAKLAEVEEELQAHAAAADPAQLTARRALFDRVSLRAHEAEEERRAARAAADRARRDADSKDEEASRLLHAAEGARRQAEEGRGALEALENEEAQLRARLVDLERKQRDLGALRGTLLEKYKDVAVGALRRELAKKKKDLEKVAGHVNQKAREEFSDFESQQQHLRKRREELTAGEAAIRKLMGHLDEKKDECLQRTFKDVALHFEAVFRELVPSGRGRLIMTRAPPGDSGDGAIADEAYIGIKVKVAFGAHEPRTMKQLSGGQKTLVSLALIFAIQRTDPTPFYLLDEVDAALDPQYRQAVAALLQRQATEGDKPSQFIVTTFHPQIVEVAAKAYGVEHRNRVSTIRDIGGTAALVFVRNDTSHRNRGEGSDAQGTSAQAIEVRKRRRRAEDDAKNAGHPQELIA